MNIWIKKWSFECFQRAVWFSNAPKTTKRYQIARGGIWGHKNVRNAFGDLGEANVSTTVFGILTGTFLTGTFQQKSVRGSQRQSVPLTQLRLLLTVEAIK